MEPALASQLADDWVRASSQYDEASALSDYVVEALTHLTSRDVLAAAATRATAPAPLAHVIVHVKELVVLLSPSGGDRPDVQLEAFSLVPTLAALGVRRYPETEPKGGVATQSIVHRWTLTLWPSRRSIEFTGKDVTKGLEPGPDRVQLLGVSLAAALGWGIGQP